MFVRAPHGFEEHRLTSPPRLGDVLYASRRGALVPESEWLELLRSVAAGSQTALHALQSRMQRIVFTLAMRITSRRELAEDATVDTFHDVWRRAHAYDADGGTVIAWIMRLARGHALDRLRAAQAGGAEKHDAARPTIAARLAARIAEEARGVAIPPSVRPWSEPPWDEVAPGISCKLLASDAERHRVSMLVRLAPRGEYPAHTHAGTEELHLLEGELWIDERKLHPGDYSRAQAPTGDKHVWSETGCTCVLVTSTQDVLH
jgi:DNA-directed RNA polymerase specialized sigma24 family protein